MTSLLLMPGMDGTGDLFDPLAAVTRRPTHRVSFPTDVALSPEELVDHAARATPGGPYAIVAESWSGPTAIRLAARRPPGLAALVLAGTFILPPVRAPLCLGLPLAAVALRAPPPAWALRLLLIGRDAGDEEVERLRSSILRNRPGVLTARAKQVLTVDVREELRRVEVPMLYLRATADRLVSRRSRDEVVAVRPDVRVAEIDAPHLLLQRAAARAMEVVEGFLVEAARRPASR